MKYVFLKTAAAGYGSNIRVIAKNMKRVAMTQFIDVILVLCLSLTLALAQTGSGKEPRQLVSVTGCFVRGDDPGEVWLAEKNGTIYGIESSKIDLKARLGQKVIVTGYVLSSAGQDDVKGTQRKGKTFKSVVNTFHALTVKTVSTTCMQ